MKYRLFIPVILGNYLFMLLAGCRSSGNSAYDNLPSDSLSLAKGKASFIQYCSGCHSIQKDGIGPKLGGITGMVSVDYLRKFIQDPKQFTNSADPHSSELFRKYNVLMPSFPSIREGELDTLISYLHSQAASAGDTSKVAGLEDPIPRKIDLSPLVLSLQPFVKFPSTSKNGNPPLARITKLSFRPDNGTLFVNDLRGNLYKIIKDHPVKYMDMSRLRPNFINEPGLATGFGSFAFHPDFAKNHLLYTTHTERPGVQKADFEFSDTIQPTVQWVVMEWKVDQPTADTFSGTGRELFRVNMVSGIHGVQDICFNPNSEPGSKDYGLLYIGVGDGGAVENGFAFLTHSKSKIWGTILRLDPTGNNSRNGHYGIPPDNPFATETDQEVLGEIFALGFRNPHRITWTHTGQMLAVNIGQEHIESINLIEPGRDYGWPLREGTFASYDVDGPHGKILPLPPSDSSFHITYPIAQYDHDEGLAICGGYEYQGKNIPGLDGKFLFGDIPTGRLFYTDLKGIRQGKEMEIHEWRAAINGKIIPLKDACGSNRVDLHFGRDGKGEMYVLTKADGQLYKISGILAAPGKNQ